MDDILGLALSPIVSWSAPASRPLASSANSSIQKSSARIQLPIALDFHSDKGREEIRKWYRKQLTTRFKRIEHRKDITGHFRHEFIVVYLDNSTICRFDRRAHEDRRGHALKDEGTISEDSAHVITLADIKSGAHLNESEVLSTIDLDQEQDLGFILTICYGIQSHPEAKSYSLLCYNCYFFSWTLFMIVKRKDLQVAYWDIGILKRAMWEDFSHMLISYIARKWGDLPIHIPGAVYPSAIAFHSSVDCYIYGGMLKSIVDYHELSVPDVPMQSRVLFWAWSPSMLREAILEALWRGSQEGAKQYVATKNPRSKLPALTHRQDIPLRLEGRARRYLKTQMALPRINKELASLKAIDELKGKTLRSDFLPLVSQKDRCRFQNEISSQEYITKRMEDHFKQVESYGFGKADKMIERARESMTEIWASICNMMEDESEFSFLA